MLARRCHVAGKLGAPALQSRQRAQQHRSSSLCGSQKQEHIQQQHECLQRAAPPQSSWAGYGPLIGLAVNVPSLAFAQALADPLADAQQALADSSSPNAAAGGLPIGEVAVLLTPVILYAIFTVYRTSFNRNAKLSDFFFALATLAVFGNILSILVFKIRFF